MWVKQTNTFTISLASTFFFIIIKVTYLSLFVYMKKNVLNSLNFPHNLMKINGEFCKSKYF